MPKIFCQLLHNYTFTLTAALGIEEVQFNGAELIVYPVNESMYEVQFQTSNNLGDLAISVYNTLGQQMYIGTLEETADGYKTQVALPGVATGMYLVRVSNGTFSTVKRIIVK